MVASSGRRTASGGEETLPQRGPVHLDSLRRTEAVRQVRVDRHELVIRHVLVHGTGHDLPATREIWVNMARSIQVAI